jgi:hypothetical protein
MAFTQRGERRAKATTVGRDARCTQTGEAPRQLDLFLRKPEEVFHADAESAATALSSALEQGKSVGLIRSAKGLVLLVAQTCQELVSQETEGRVALGETCGFSRRANELVSQTVEREGRQLWARPAGTAWNGWIEWGTLVVDAV